MGPVAAKRSAGQQAIAISARPAQRAKHESEYGRRAKGDVFGARWETTGSCWTPCYPRRTQAHCSDFLCFCYVDQHVPADHERLYAILDHLDRHHCHDLLLFQIHHARCEFVYQPTYAADLNLIEPWWKILRALALAGRRFESWPEIVAAVEAATADWNTQPHPFVWGQRHRHQSPRRAQRCPFAVKVLRI